MVIGRKTKKIDMRIEGVSVEQADSFKYLGCSLNISSKQQHELLSESIAEDSNGKRSFNRKRIIICGLLEKELRKRIVNCFVWSVTLYGAET